MKSPLAPRTSDESFSAFAPFKRRQENTSKCFVYVLSFLVAVSAVSLIFALIFLRAFTPQAELTSVTVKNLNHSPHAVNATSNTTTWLTSLNVTLTASIEMENPNFGRFEYDNGTVSVLFEGVEIGRGATARGAIGGRGMERTSVTVRVRSVRQVENNTSFVNGVESGVVELTSYGELRGRVHLINAIEKVKVCVVQCRMNLNLKNQNIQNLVCK